MRRLFILRGAPFSGKTTWAEKSGFAQYCISLAEVKRLYSSPVYAPDGNTYVPENKTKVSPLVSKLLADRMSRGELIIIDGCHCDTDDMRGYKGLVNDFRYRTYVVDFTDIDEETLLSRAGAENAPQTDIDEISRFCARAPHQELPGGYEKVSPEEACSLICECAPYDLSAYKAVNFFGDVHGCATALFDTLAKIGCANGHLLDDEFYVFCGDYIDRGLENAEVLEYLMDIAELDNVMLLEGNHERWLDDWAHGREPKSRTFRHKTSKELESADVSKKRVSRFYRRLIPAAWLSLADGIRIFACHGGIPVFPYPYASISAEQLVKGVGDYRDADEVNACWEDSAGADGIYQIHGHRNAKNTEIHPFEHVFSLEGAVERGGALRCVRFEAGADPVCIETSNTVFEHLSCDIPLEEMSFEDALANLRANPMIKEKNLGHGISSFNFTREAFSKNAWDVQSIKARGLFLDTDNDMMMARSYDKFFNIGEQEASFEQVCSRFTYPVDVYRKENGYLGIAAPDGDGKLFFASKSTTQGDYAFEFKRLLISTLGGSLSKFADYLEDIDASAVFEVIIPEFDRHIVEYDKAKVVLLDIIYNDFAFEHIDYDELVYIAAKFKLEVKERLCVLDTKRQLAEWYETVSSPDYVPDDGMHIEGYVLEDADGYMVKVKSDWYRYWKAIRSIIHDVMKRGRSARLAPLRKTHKEVDEFYEWLKEYIADWQDKGHKEDPHVIDVRRDWRNKSKR